MSILSSALGLGISACRTAHGRYKARSVALKLAGIWGAYDFAGRDLVPMKGASITVIAPRSLWSSNPYILDVYGRDFLDGRLREHDGYLVIDRECPTRATRTLIYRDSGETTRQQVEIDGSSKTLTIFPVESGYGKHALRRAGLLGLN
jgi:hypothetical protein